ncbi:MAG: M23 family metallopeptidase [Desulfopila sp.]
MNERIHILITGERGKTIKFHACRKKVRTYTLVGIISLLTLTVASIASLSQFAKSRAYAQKVAALEDELNDSHQHIARLQYDSSSEHDRLRQQIANLKRKNINQLAEFTEERDQLLSTAVNELNQRSELFDAMMAKIGVKIKPGTSKNTPNSGGPFIALQPGIQGELLDRADNVLETIKAIPLGRPATGKITSRFGPRRDPINSKRGYHEGIDVKGNTGDDIYATGAGVVTRACRNGSYGNYVEIDHKNGYKTAFAHLEKYLVAVGDKVKRGQLIGYLGNTGRSTGPHLHYEVLYRGKPVNPLKYLQVAKLAKLETTRK